MDPETSAWGTFSLCVAQTVSYVAVLSCGACIFCNNQAHYICTQHAHLFSVVLCERGLYRISQFS